MPGTRRRCYKFHTRRKSLCCAKKTRRGRRSRRSNSINTFRKPKAMWERHRPATIWSSIEHTYSTPTETHNPMETHATIASWERSAPDRLTIYDATQYVKGAQGIVAQAFGLPRDNVHVICPFVGGAFGCKGPVWTHTILAAMAAKVVNRPVRVELTRQQMFSGTGHRTPTFQTTALAATGDGNYRRFVTTVKW